MANFPFDPTPFLPPDRDALEFAGRPARVRVIHGDMRLSNEDLAIITILPMPQGEVAFQNVHQILGPIPAHEEVEAPVDNGPLVANQVVNHPIHMAIENQLAENAVPWDHWANPPAVEMIDMELHAGEFLELNDLIGPAVELPDAHEADEELGSDLTLTMNLPSEDNSTDNSIQVEENIEQMIDHGLDHQVENHVPVLDLFPFPDIEEDQDNHDDNMMVQNQVLDSNTVEGHATAPMSDLVLFTEISNNMADVPMSHQSDKDILPVPNMPDQTITDKESMDSIAEKINTSSVEGTKVMIVDKVDDSEIKEKMIEKTALEQQNTDTISPTVMIADDSESGNSTAGAPPGFPIPMYKDNVRMDEEDGLADVCTNTIDQTSQIMLESCHFSDAGYLGEEGLTLWKEHFAPKTDNDKTTKVQNERTPDRAICGPAGNATTSAIHGQKKRKEKAPLVETEVDPGNCTEEDLHQTEKKKKVQKNMTQAQGREQEKEC
ncbi:unnamed protein product [Alopecurus aequalis]